MWQYQVSVFLLMLSYSVFGSVCKSNEREDKYFRAYNEEMNWYEALLNCSRQGMTLATVHSQQEQNKLVNAIQECEGDSTTWWIGGSDLHEKGDYIWFSTNEPITYNNYQTKQPDNHNYNGDTEHCLEVRNNGYTYIWNDNFCNSKRTFICEYYECTTTINSYFNDLS